MAEKNHRMEDRNRHLEEKVMMVSEQLSRVESTLNNFIRSEQASDFGSYLPPTLHPRQHRCSTSYALPLSLPPPPQPECQDDDDDDDDGGDSDGDGDGDGNVSNLASENLRYDQDPNYNYFNY